MKDSQLFLIKTLFAGLVIALAILRWVNIRDAKQQMDSTFLYLVAAAFLILVIPWDKLRTFKAGGVELFIDQPQVKGAIEGLGLQRVDSRQLRRTLSGLEAEIGLVDGSRVLWIDDRPHEILGERRILRSLGIEVITAVDNISARSKLGEDNDFDLIISDVQRSEQVNGYTSIYGGMYFAKELRESHPDPTIRSLPVIFYSAFRQDQIERIVRRVSGEALSDTASCDSIEALLSSVITTLSEVRSNPITVRSTKKPTSPRRAIFGARQSEDKEEEDTMEGPTEEEEEEEKDTMEGPTDEEEECRYSRDA